MKWIERSDESFVYKPDPAHEFSTAFSMPEKKWVLYHTIKAPDYCSSRVGLFDTLREAQDLSDVIYQASKQ